MKYGLTEELQSVNKSKYPTYLPGGIHENVSLTKVAWEPLKEGDERFGVRFYFENENGVYNHFEWYNGEDTDEKKVISLLKRYNNIASVFAPKEEVQKAIGGDTVKEVLESIITFLEGKLDKELCRIKLVYNSKGNAGFTPYPGFINNMKSPASDVRQGKEESFVKPEKKANDTGVSEFGNTPLKDDELPF